MLQLLLVLTASATCSAYFFLQQLVLLHPLILLFPLSCLLLPLSQVLLFRVYVLLLLEEQRLGVERIQGDCQVFL